MTDEQERAMGTHPLDATSRLQVVEWKPDDAGRSVLGTFSSVAGRDYRIFTSGDLSGWTDCGTMRAADWPATSTRFELEPPSVPAGSLPQRLFIRITTPAR